MQSKRTACTPAGGSLAEEMADSAVGGRIGRRPWLLGATVGLGLFAFSVTGIVLLHHAADRVLAAAQEESLRLVCQAAVGAVHPDLHSTLASDDAGTPARQQAIERLENMQRSLPMVREVFTVRRDRTGTTVRTIDIRAADRHEGRPDAATAYEPDDAMRSAFLTRSTATSLTIRSGADGPIVRGYAPISATERGVECLAGVDMDATEYLDRQDAVHVAVAAAIGIAAIGSTGVGFAVAGNRAKRLVRARREQVERRRLEQLTENIPGGVFVYEECISRNGKILFASHAFDRLFGAQAAPASTLPMIAVVDDRDAAAMLADLRGSADRMEAWHGEYRLPAPAPVGEGQRWIEIRAMPSSRPGGAVRWYGFVADITERKHAEEALVQARADAERANRAKTDFISNVSHEIRTPMTAILGYAEVLRDERETGIATGVGNGAVDAILRNGEHLLEVVNDLVDLSRVEPGQLMVRRSRIDLGAVARDAAALLAGRAESKGLALVVEAPADPVIADSDPLRVRQILLNLVGNAIKFTDRGSIRVTIAAEGDAAVALVRDTGCGMDDGQVARLFHRYSQVDPARAAGGSGLGLALSRHLARRLGGDLVVESVPGEGSTFRLVLPARVPATSDEPRRPEAAPADLTGLRVLLADDGPDNLRLFRHHLEAAGARVQSATNGREAVTLLHAAELGVLEAPFDIVLLDIEMPVLDGLAAARELRARFPSVPLLAMTAQDDATAADRCRDAGFDATLSKPIDRRALLDAVRRWAREPAAGGAAPLSAEAAVASPDS